MGAAAGRERVLEAWPVAVGLDSAACLTIQRPGVSCTACQSACPETAIAIADRSVRIDPAACSGCGRCAADCPTGAIRSRAFAPARVYECSRVRKPATGATAMPCLGGLLSEHLRDALQAGEVTLIDRGWCAECPVSGGQAAPWNRAVAAVNAEADQLRLDARVHVRREPLGRWRRLAPPARQATDPGRRSLFLRFAHAGAPAVPAADPLAGLPDTAAVPGLRRRHAQLSALAANKALPAALFPMLEVRRPGADLRALARLCPTAALSVTDGDGCESLAFDPVACIGCGLCAATGELARTPNPGGVFAGVVMLASQSVTTCSCCRMRFSPRGAQTVCDGCARDTNLAALAHGLRRHV